MSVSDFEKTLRAELVQLDRKKAAFRAARETAASDLHPFYDIQIKRLDTQRVGLSAAIRAYEAAAKLGDK